MINDSKKRNLALTPKSELPFTAKEAWIRLIIYYALILALLFTLQLGLGDLIVVLLSLPNNPNTTLLIVNVRGAIIGVCGIGLTYIFLKYDDKSFSQIGVKFRKNLKLLTILALGITVLALFTAYVIEIASGVVIFEQIMKDRFRIESDFNDIINFLIRFIVVFGGIAIGEEIIFRGYLFNIMLDHLSTFKAAVVSSALFGSLHFFIFSANTVDPAQTMIAVSISAFFFGFVFCYAYLLSGRNIVFPIIIHGIWNNIIFFFNTQFHYSTLFLVVMEIISQITAAFVLIGLMYLFRNKIKDKQQIF